MYVRTASRAVFKGGGEGHFPPLVSFSLPLASVPHIRLLPPPPHLAIFWYTALARVLQHMHAHIYIRTCMYVCTHMCTCMYVNVPMYVCIGVEHVQDWRS